MLIQQMLIEHLLYARYYLDSRNTMVNKTDKNSCNHDTDHILIKVLFSVKHQ